MPEIDLGLVVGPHFTPSVDTVEGNSVLSWSNDGGLPNPEPVKISPTLVAGENISLNREGDTLRISATAATYQNATASSDGLMSKTDKAKLDGIPADATNNAGTITGITMNGVSKGASGVVDLGTVLTEHQDISGKLDASRLGAANGAAELDANGKVPAAQLPAYVDDVQEYVSLSAFPAAGESGKIYVAVDTNRTYRWSGSAYVEISQSLALGETASTAYRGDRGKTSYDHAQTTSGNPHNVTKNDVGLGNVPNVATNDQTPTYTTASTLSVLTSGEKLSAAFGKIAKGIADLISHLDDAVKHITAAERTAWNNKVDKVSGKGLSTNDYTTAEKNKLSGIEADATANAPASAAPLMDGTASVGTSVKYAREDHKHPTDTSRASAADVEKLMALVPYMELHKSASGNPVTFGDGSASPVQNLSVTLTPIQSGSGDPYPPGGGKNLLDTSRCVSTTINGITFTANRDSSGNLLSIRCNGISTDNDTWYNISTFTSEVGVRYIVSGCPTGGGTYRIVVYNLATDTGNGMEFNGNGISESVRINFLEGATANNLEFYPMIRRATDTDPTFAPYSNIRPISGVSSVSVTRMGKNQCPLEAVTTTRNGLTFTVDQNAGTVTVNGTASATTVFFLNSYSDRYVGNNWILSGCPSGGDANTFALRVYEGESGYVTETGSESTMIGMENLSLGILIRNGAAMSNKVFYPMIRRASDTDPTFEPYQGQSVSVQLTDGSNPLTVYGGTLDVTTGELAVTWANIPSYNGETLPGVWISDRDVYTPGATPTIGAQVAYKLATPVTYQLTPQQLATLYGSNTISTDAGTLSVTYRADPILALLVL